MKTYLRLATCVVLLLSLAPLPAQAQTPPLKTYLPVLIMTRPVKYAGLTWFCYKGGICYETLIYKNVSDYPIANLVLKVVSADQISFRLLKGKLDVMPPGQMNYFDTVSKQGETYYFASWTTENITPTVPLSITLYYDIIIRNQTDQPIHNVEYVFTRIGMRRAFHTFITPDTLLPGQVYTATQPSCDGCGISGPGDAIYMTAQGNP